ncbi:hypothetical protein GCM10009617_18860 [Leifsonia poae]|uniref:Uncharacterized protein n=1 Tax=Leifsonia poae TaxID=110933 RepID=A0A9W6HCP7_9MICO|nr:hypothetical protein GCM10017584_34610 [Leifsonia poae]
MGAGTAVGAGLAVGDAASGRLAVTEGDGSGVAVVAFAGDASTQLATSAAATAAVVANWETVGIGGAPQLWTDPSGKNATESTVDERDCSMVGRVHRFGVGRSDGSKLKASVEV